MHSQNSDKPSPTSPQLEEPNEPHTDEATQDVNDLPNQEASQVKVQDINQPSDALQDSSESVSAAEMSSKTDQGETQPYRLEEDGINLPPEIPDAVDEKPRRRHMWILWAFVVVIVLLLIAGLSGFMGYNRAVGERKQAESTQFSGEAANQYILAQQDIAQGNFDRARQRLEYIIQLDPGYPNASDQLAFVLTQQRITATPTVMPTPTLTPTPDLRGRDDMFTQAQALLAARDWTGTIDTLLLLRKNYPDYMPVKVDDMLFVALRNRGIDKISQKHDLEGGNYDLTLAERFGPLDTEANNWRDWADMYIRGASFWDVDWAQAVYYFSQLANAAPGITDSSGWTAQNRYMDALLGYGDWFASQEQWCDAQAQYDTYMTLLASSQVEPTAVYAADKCNQQQNPPPPPAPVVTETPATSGTPAPTEMVTPATPSPTDTQPATTPSPQP